MNPSSGGLLPRFRFFSLLGCYSGIARRLLSLVTEFTSQLLSGNNWSSSAPSEAAPVFSGLTGGFNIRGRVFP